MNFLEIALLIIGVVIIIISIILVDKSKSTGQMLVQSFSYDNNVSEDDKKKLLERLKELLSDISEGIIINTDDILSKLSNEKIMAVNDFSEQILEKIKRNHEEVVFLYNMLNDKEKELKSVIREIDSSKNKVQEILEAKVSAENSRKRKTAPTKIEENPITQVSKIDKQKKTNSIKTEQLQETPILNSLSSNYNSQILALFSQGKSIIEISKLLELGQGEVKLVVDLYKGKK